MPIYKCTTRGCLADTEAKLDTDTDQVICEDCGNHIVGITPMMKKMLKSCGQIFRNKKVMPFQQYCQTCKENRSLYVKNGAAFCKQCDTQVQVTPSFLQGLKVHLESQAAYEKDGVE